MKLNSLPVLCLSLVLFHAYSSLAQKGRSSFGKGSFFSKKSPPSRTNTHSNTGSKTNQGSKTKQSNQGKTGYQGNHPKQPGARMHYANVGAHGSQPGLGRPGSYPGGYLNRNPNNQILSPHYGGSFGYGGYGAGHGSPFSHSVQAMGVYPQDKSRGFGRSAVAAAAGGAVAGMAVGYGLGRFPRPHFHFHSPREERYYNHYMYRVYGVKSTDANDYSRDYKYSPPPVTYDSYMDSCMKRSDILTGENQKPKTTYNTTTITPTTTTTHVTSTLNSNTTQANNTSAENSPTTAPKAHPVLPASSGHEEEDDDTVSIVEIGYPALIEQLKARICVERYMLYSAEYLRLTGGVQGLTLSFHGRLAVVTSTVLVLLNSNMLI